jgi:hypothetical protein
MIGSVDLQLAPGIGLSALVASASREPGFSDRDLLWALGNLLWMAVFIFRKFPEMRNKQIAIAAAFACLCFVAFIVAGVFLPLGDAQIVCFTINLLQSLVQVLLELHWRMNTLSRF